MSRILNNGKWHDVWNKPKYQEFRDRILNAFNGLVFEEGPHKYYLNGVEITCVSNVTHLFQEKFDEEGIAQKTFEKHYNNPDSKYYQMTVEEIIKSWRDNSKQACDHGTERHEFGESCFYFMTEQYDKILPAFKDRLILPENNDGKYGFEAIYPKEEATVKFWEEIPQCVVPILAENKVYDSSLGYSGTFDMLFYYDAELDGKSADKSGFYIMDYKTNKDLYKNFNEKKLLTPFNELLDMPLNIYKLQLSLYQNCIELIDMHVIARSLIWLKPNGEYEKVKLEEYVKKLRDALSKMNLLEHKK